MSDKRFTTALVRLGLVSALIAGLAACSSSGYQAPSVPKPKPSEVPLVGSVEPRRSVSIENTLDIAISVFDQGLDQTLSQTPGGSQAFPTVRKAESLILPVILAEQLRSSEAFGVVRVTHSEAVFLPLVLGGEIREADGLSLELKIYLRTAEGRELFSRIYRDEATEEDYPLSGDDPFADLYRAVSNDVVAALEAMSAAERRRLDQLATMRFASELAPDSFSRFLSGGDDKPYALVSYPSDNDPMLARLQRVRRQDELFIDTVDQQYADLFDQVSESYDLWREYGFELRRYGDDYRLSASERKRNARRGSYAAMQQVYASYRKVKIQEEDLRGLVQGFAGDALETVIEVDDGVFRLSGSVDDRYRQWQQILTRINALEVGDI